MSAATTEPVALLLCDDLMWTSRVAGTGQALGFKVVAVPTVEKLEAVARRLPTTCVILDLAAVKAPTAEIVTRLRAACEVPPRFVAFGSHVDTATLQAARDAGCDPVLPRSKMAEGLPELLKEWLS